MQARAPCVATTESIAAVAQRMRDDKTTFLPVSDGARVVGVVTASDIAVRAVAEGLPTSAPVERIMTRNVISCRATDEVGLIHELMRRHHVSTIVCTNENGELAGVVALQDLAHDVDLRLAKTVLEVVSRREKTAS